MWTFKQFVSCPIMDVPGWREHGVLAIHNSVFFCWKLCDHLAPHLILPSPLTHAILYYHAVHLRAHSATLPTASIAGSDRSVLSTDMSVMADTSENRLIGSKKHLEIYLKGQLGPSWHFLSSKCQLCLTHRKLKSKSTSVEIFPKQKNPISPWSLWN